MIDFMKTFVIIWVSMMFTVMAIILLANIYISYYLVSDKLS